MYSNFKTNKKKKYVSHKLDQLKYFCLCACFCFMCLYLTNDPETGSSSRTMSPQGLLRLLLEII